MLLKPVSLSKVYEAFLISLAFFSRWAIVTVIVTVIIERPVADVAAGEPRSAP